MYQPITIAPQKDFIVQEELFNLLHVNMEQFIKVIEFKDRISKAEQDKGFVMNEEKWQRVINKEKDFLSQIFPEDKSQYFSVLFLDGLLEKMGVSDAFHRTLILRMILEDNLGLMNLHQYYEPLWNEIFGEKLLCFSEKNSWSLSLKKDGTQYMFHTKIEVHILKGMIPEDLLQQGNDAVGTVNYKFCFNTHNGEMYLYPAEMTFSAKVLESRNIFKPIFDKYDDFLEKKQLPDKDNLKLQFDFFNPILVGKMVSDSFKKSMKKIEILRKEIELNEIIDQERQDKWDYEVKRGYAFTKELLAIPAKDFSTVHIRTALNDYGVTDYAKQTFILKMLLQIEEGLINGVGAGFSGAMLEMFGTGLLIQDTRQISCLLDKDRNLIFSVGMNFRFPNGLMPNDRTIRLNSLDPVGHVTSKFSINIDNCAVNVFPSEVIFYNNVLKRRHIFDVIKERPRIFFENNMKELYYDEMNFHKIKMEKWLEMISFLSESYELIKMKNLPHENKFDMEEYKNKYIFAEEENGLFYINNCGELKKVGNNDKKLEETREKHLLSEIQRFFEKELYGFIKTEAMEKINGIDFWSMSSASQFIQQDSGVDFWCVSTQPSHQELLKYQDAYILTPEKILRIEEGRRKTIEIKDKNLFEKLSHTSSFSKISTLTQPILLKELLTPEQVEMIWYLIRLSASEYQWFLGRGQQHDLDDLITRFDLEHQIESQREFEDLYNRNLAFSRRTDVQYFIREAQTVLPTFNETRTRLEKNYKQPFLLQMLSKPFFYCEASAWDEKDESIERSIFAFGKLYYKLNISKWNDLQKEKLKEFIETRLSDKPYKVYSEFLTGLYEKNQQNLGVVKGFLEKTSIDDFWEKNGFVTERKNELNIISADFLQQEFSANKIQEISSEKDVLTAYLDGYEKASSVDEKVSLGFGLFYKLTGKTVFQEVFPEISIETFCYLFRNEFKFLLQPPENRKIPLLMSLGEYTSGIVEYIKVCQSKESFAKKDISFKDDVSLILDFLEEQYSLWNGSYPIEERMARIEKSLKNAKEEHDQLKSVMRSSELSFLISQWKIDFYDILLQLVKMTAMYLKTHIDRSIDSGMTKGLEIYLADEPGIAVTRLTESLKNVEEKIKEYEASRNVSANMLAYIQQNNALTAIEYQKGLEVEKEKWKLGEKNLNTQLIVLAEVNKVCERFSKIEDPEQLKREKGHLSQQVVFLDEKINDLKLMKMMLMELQKDLSKRYKLGSSDRFNFWTVSMEKEPTLSMLNREYKRSIPMIILVKETGNVFLYGHSLNKQPQLTQIEKILCQWLSFPSTLGKADRISVSNLPDYLQAKLTLIYKDIAQKRAHFTDFIPKSWETKELSEIQLKWISHASLLIDLEIVKKIIDKGHAPFLDKLLRQSLCPLEKKSFGEQVGEIQELSFIEQIISFIKEADSSRQVNFARIREMKKTIIDLLKNMVLPIEVLRNPNSQDVRVYESIKDMILSYASRLEGYDDESLTMQLIMFGSKPGEHLLQRLALLAALATAYYEARVKGNIKILREAIPLLMKKTQVTWLGMSEFKNTLEKILAQTYLIRTSLIDENERKGAKEKWLEILKWFSTGAKIEVLSPLEEEEKFKKLLQENNQLRTQEVSELREALEKEKEASRQREEALKAEFETKLKRESETRDEQHNQMLWLFQQLMPQGVIVEKKEEKKSAEVSGTGVGFFEQGKRLSQAKLISEEPREAQKMEEKAEEIIDEEEEKAFGHK